MAKRKETLTIEGLLWGQRFCATMLVASYSMVDGVRRSVYVYVPLVGQG